MTRCHVSGTTSGKTWFRQSWSMDPHLSRHPMNLVRARWTANQGSPALWRVAPHELDTIPSSGSRAGVAGSNPGGSFVGDGALRGNGSMEILLSWPADFAALCRLSAIPD